MIEWNSLIVSFLEHYLLGDVMNKRGKLNKIKILGAVCLSFIIIGVCVGYNSSKETSFFSEIKDKNLLAADIVSPQTWGGCKWII